MHPITIHGWHSLALRTLASRTLARRQLPFEDICPVDTCQPETLALWRLAIWDTCQSGQLPCEDTCHSSRCHLRHLPFWGTSHSEISAILRHMHILRHLPFRKFLFALFEFLRVKSNIRYRAKPQNLVCPSLCSVRTPRPLFKALKASHDLAFGTEMFKFKIQL